eukprot:CAMPEP_0194070020 /NCGR_PEP_ID=MMETSP0009_2-20130614/87956_1 /TAXON_ID=210454 /ORGANISM="Grammatophora oceanica, Strain CCMP 410" /LENGTH=289 /DNA_ID=CAMNT_0038723257 /DNA_START=60 /DNA_END=926 /DNA_ORIENTATION=-
MPEGGKQLLLNYCFGHAESSLLLCPYTSAILLNHCSPRQSRDCGDGPNAKVRIQSGWDKSTSSWLEMTVEDMKNRTDRGVSFEIVALRDIARGEEVTIDYGVEWERAWEAHVAQWRSPDRQGTGFESATRANHGLESTLPRLLSNDLRKEFEHPNLVCGCFYEATHVDYHPRWDMDFGNWMEMTDDELLQTYSDDGSRFVNEYTTHRGGDYWECSLIRQDGNERFTVRIWPSHENEIPLWARNELPRYLTNYPQESIQVFHKQYHSDQHLSGAFRHHIGIPEEMMPKNW